MSSLAFSPTGHEERPFPLLFGTLSAFVVSLLLFWRRRYPRTVMTITVVAGMAFSIGASASWVALGSLYRRRVGPFFSDPWLWASTIAVAINTHIMVLRDLAVPDSERSIVGIFLETPPGQDWAGNLSPLLAPTLTLVMVALVVGVSLVARSRADLSKATLQMREAEQQYETLSHELARYEEREKIASELHDSLGHTLAQLSVLAGAMRANPTDVDETSQTADQLQQVAISATEELHDIVRTFRSGSPPEITLADLPDLIDDSIASGMRINATLQVDLNQPMPPPVERAVYRVVQEITTNAAKHAPEHVLRITVTGGLHSGGIEILASNPLPTQRPQLPTTGGMGLIGAAERVEQLGGWLRYGVGEGDFRVQVWVPCRPVGIAYP